MNNHTPHTPDHTPDPAEIQEADLTAYALGELDPSSERYAAVEARLVDDAEARAYVEQARTLGGELARQYAQASAADEGLGQVQRDAVVATIDAEQDDQPDQAQPRPAVAGKVGGGSRFSRKALLAAGLALAAGAAITTAVLVNQGGQSNDPNPIVTSPPAPPTDPMDVVDRLNTAVDASYDATPLNDALADLSRQAAAPITIDWAALHKRGINPQTPISFKADQAPAGAVLALILQQAWQQSPHPDPVVWTLAETGIRVEPRSAAVDRMLTASRDAIAASNPRITKSRAELFALTPTLADVLPEIFVVELTPSPEAPPSRAAAVLAELDKRVAEESGGTPGHDLIRNARVQISQEKEAEADDAIRNGKIILAVQLYGEAILLDPDNQSLSVKHADAQEQLNNQLQPLDPNTDRAIQMQIARGEAIARYEAAAAVAQLSLENKQYQQALDATLEARTALNNARSNFDQAEYNERVARAASLQAAIQEQRSMDHALATAQAEQVRTESEQQLTREPGIARDAEVDRRIRRARELQQNRNYQQALGELSAARQLDPNNESVDALATMMEELVVGTEGDRLHRQLDLMRANQRLLSDESSAPYDRRYASMTLRPELSERREEQEKVGDLESRITNGLHSYDPGSGVVVLSDGAAPHEQLAVDIYNFRGFALDPNAPVAFVPGNPTGENRWAYFYAGDAAGQPVQLGVEVPDFTQAPSFDLNDALANINSATPESIALATDGQGGGLFGDDKAKEASDIDVIGNTRTDRLVILRRINGLEPGRPLAFPDIEGLDPADIRIPDPVTPGDIYAIVNDNPFHMVFEQPLSTFSVDVDTAGYSIIRRQVLQQGVLPQPQHVRIEEMINYFDYTYEAPQVDGKLLADGVVTQATIDQLEAADPGFAPFATHTEVTDCPWAEGHKLVRVGIKGMEVAMEDRPPSHLTFLIDVSGSMSSADKLPLVKQSLKLLLDQLNPDDKVSIVVYAGASGLALEPTAVADRHKIVEALDRLNSGGSTAGAAGIQLAYQVAQDNFVDGGVNRVILCTDGDFNVGVSGTDALVELIKEKANPQADDDGLKRGVYFSAMGFGSGNLNDQMMELITNAGNGNYAYIDSLQEATKVMYDQAGATLVTIAKDVKIQVDFDPAQVLSYRLIGYENRILAAEDFENDQVDAGDIGAGHTVTALYEVVPFDADWQDNNDGPAVQLRIKQLKDAIATNATLLQTTRLTEEQQLKLGAATQLLQQELRQASAMSQRMAMKAPGTGNAVKQAPDRGVGPEPMLVVNLRYKPVDAPAEDGTSRLIEKPVLPEAVAFDQASEDMRFAASVAGLGMALRKSPHFAGGSYDWIVDTAKGASTHDPHGYRAQFITLAEKARELSGGVASEPEADE